MLEPVAVALKFGFIAVLYLFLLWVVLSVARDLRSQRESDVADIRSVAVESEAPGGAGAPKPSYGRIVIVRGKGLKEGLAFQIEEGLTFGRSKSCDLMLEDDYVSQRHARAFGRDSNAYIEDLGSTNGTFLNGKLLESRERLKHKDKLTIGDFEFRYEV